MVKTIKTKLMLSEEARLGGPLEKLIPETYGRLGSLDATSKALGLSINTLYLWMARLGLLISHKRTIVSNRK